MNRPVLVFVVLILAACGRAAPDMPQQPFNSPGVSFSITPSAARDCEPDTVYQARIDWRIENPKPKTRLEIRVNATDGALFARSNDPVGSEQTGPWVARGTWFLLLDRESGKLLAAQRAGPETCY